MLELRLAEPSDKPLRVLCLGAHSDDIEIGCGGTILTLLERYKNVEVRWVILSATGEREREARASAERLLQQAKAKEVIVHPYRDGYFPFQGAEIKEAFETLKHGFVPDLIFTHYREDRHQDHRLISDLTWNTFRNHLIFEYEIPKYDGDLGTPNVFVPLTEAVCEQKVKTLMECFGTQRGKHWFDEETFRALARLRGLEAGGGTRYAEAFYGRKVVMG